MFDGVAIFDHFSQGDYNPSWKTKIVGPQYLSGCLGLPARAGCLPNFTPSWLHFFHHKFCRLYPTVELLANRLSKWYDIFGVHEVLISTWLTVDSGASDEKGTDGNGVDRRQIKYSARCYSIIFCYCNYCHYGCDYYEKEVQRVFLVPCLSLFATNIIYVILIGGTLVFNARY